MKSQNNELMIKIANLENNLENLQKQQKNAMDNTGNVVDIELKT